MPSPLILTPASNTGVDAQPSRPSSVHTVHEESVLRPWGARIWDVGWEEAGRGLGLFGQDPWVG